MTRRRLSEREVVAVVARQLDTHPIQTGMACTAYVARIICPICHRPIKDFSKIERDHDDAIGFGEGRDTLENCRYVHGHCHRKKTADDKRRMAKADRAAGRTGQKARRKRRGGSQIKSGPMPGTRKSGWRKPMNRPAERREP